MPDIESIQKENRVFPPPAEFSRKAHVKSLAEYRKLYDDAAKDPEKFWAEAAGQLRWSKKWSRVLDWSTAPFAKWFVDGKLNLADNCIDRHLEGPRKNKTAILWVGEPGDERRITYAELHREVCKFANVLKRDLGVKAGDRVTIYMPMIPEVAIAMLACARIGAAHSVIFGGFSADALVDRIEDAQSEVLITADGGWRRGQIVPLKTNVDEALKRTKIVRKVVVAKRTGQDVPMAAGRDVWWHDAMAKASPDCPAEPFDAEQLLFILYTSGTTGKPKGIIHTTGGYLTQAMLTHKWIFDIREEDVFWCTADVGWITGHSYVVYGPLANGATTLMYEGAPNQPGPDRFWEIIAKYKATILYTAPTAIRAFIKWGDEHPKRHDLSSLRLLGTVGEPINPEAWMWYHRVIGGERCPIVDTWWQTETGAIMLSPLPGAIPTKPGTATLPFPGIIADVVAKGTAAPVKPNEGGYLVLKKPWPAMLRGIYGDPERFKKQYWSEFPGIYFAGDGARRDDDGYFWVMGRVDDVIKVAGHRLGTAEVESALVSHPAVAEAAVVGKPDEIKGESIAAFVTLKPGHKPDDALKAALREHVAKSVGAIAKPDEVRFTDTLPKTRSGKIMRRLLREIAAGGAVKGDTTTLEDIGVLAKLRQDDE